MMRQMRQRLLLVAGWLLAAVGSAVVASGAVAVAGGQVLDRPLRPLTAAEVAALPVVRSTAGTEPSEPLASGGIVSTPEPAPIHDIAGTGADREPRPGGASASPPPPADLDPVVEPEARSTARLVRVTGGRISVASRNDALTLLWAAPTPGYVVVADIVDDGTIEVTFTGDPTRDVVTIHIEDGELVVDSKTEPIR